MELEHFHLSYLTHPLVSCELWDVAKDQEYNEKPHGLCIDGIQDIPWSGVVLSCLQCIAIDTPDMITRLPVFGTNHMKTT